MDRNRPGAGSSETLACAPSIGKVDLPVPTPFVRIGRSPLQIGHKIAAEIRPLHSDAAGAEAAVGQHDGGAGVDRRPLRGAGSATEFSEDGDDFTAYSAFAHLADAEFVGRLDRGRRAIDRLDFDALDSDVDAPDVDALEFDGWAFDGSAFGGSDFDGSDFDGSDFDPSNVPAGERWRRLA